MVCFLFLSNKFGSPQKVEKVKFTKTIFLAYPPVLTPCDGRKLYTNCSPHKCKQKKSYFYPYHSTRSVKKRLFLQHINRLTIFPMKLSFSGVSALEKVKMIKSFGVLILEKTENSVEGVNGTLLI